LYAATEEPVPTSSPPITQAVFVIEPVGAAWNVPTVPVMVPLVHVIACFARIVKSDPAIDARLLMLDMPDVTMGDDTSLHAEARSAIAAKAVSRVVLLLFMGLVSTKGTRPAGLARKGRRQRAASDLCSECYYCLMTGAAR